MVHHDFYALAGIGAAFEQAMMPDATGAVSPAFAIGVGARVFLNPNSALRLQLRDDFVIQKRVKTVDSQGTFLKQNVALTVAYCFMGKGK